MQRRDVAVVLGNSSLTLLDSRTDTVLAHWSLPAVQRLNPDQRPALYCPATAHGEQDSDAEEGETLELDDPLLIEALEAINKALNPPERRHWLRGGIGAASLALVVLASVFWLPPALIDHTAGIVPPAGRAQIARAALDTLPASFQGARVCTHAGGRQALATLRARILGGTYRAVAISGVPGFEAAHLPGQLILLGEGLLSRLDTPKALAGYLLAEEHAARSHDPLRAVLRHAGIRATLSLLTTGHLPDRALDGYLARRLTHSPARPEPEAFAAALTALGLSARPYADAMGTDGAALIEAQAAMPPGEAIEPAGRLLGDGEWLMLQAICDN